MKRGLMAIWFVAVVAGGALAQQTKSVPAPPKPGAGPTATSGAKPLTLKTEKEKFSYALGMKMGENLHKQLVPVDQAIVARGLRDGLAAGRMLLTDDEAQAAIVGMQSDVRKSRAAANKQEGDAFLAANQGKEGVVTLPSGLQYKILVAGTGAMPTASDTVVCNYRGRLISGKEFDSSYKRGQAASFPVSGVIKGWTEALQMMPAGSKWQLFIPPDLAYGERGVGDDIGPSATLIFEVELVSIAGRSNAAEEPRVAPPQCNALDGAVQIEDAEPSGTGHCGGEVDYWFTNVSSQAIDCAIIFRKNGHYDVASLLTFALQPGERSGGAGKISSCGADKMQYQCFAHAENAANSCTGKIQWQQ